MTQLSEQGTGSWRALPSSPAHYSAAALGTTAAQPATLDPSGSEPPFCYRHGLCGSGDRTGYSQGGLSLLHSIWGLSQKDLKVKRDSVARR